VSSPSETRSSAPLSRRILGWLVHGYTGLGLVAVAVMAVLIVRADPDSIRLTFFVMLIATLVDATDGTLARAIDIKRTVPEFDGARLDDIIDFQTYVTLPMLLIYQTGLLSGGQNVALLAPILASGVGFCRVNAKTSDGYFLGFPSYWNIVAFYLYVLQAPEIVTLGLLLVLGVMTIVPLRYLNTARPTPLNLFSNALAIPWAVMLVIAVYQLGSDTASFLKAQWWTWASLFYPAYYMLVSWLINLRRPIVR
jgi:phosphatidylcholine synthase